MSAKAQGVTITLYPGWNWISYPKAEILDVNTALGDFVPMEGDIIKSQFSSSLYVNGYWRGGVTHFMPGWGYMYYSNRTEMVSFVFGTPAPQLIVTTEEPTEITAISAISGGSLTSSDGSYIVVLEKGICWATHPNPTVMNDFHTENGSGINGFTAEMTDLEINTMYYVRAYAVTERGTIYGEEMNFTTRDGIPEVSTAIVTNITVNGAVCGGNVTDDGGLEVIERGVCWSTNSNPTISDSHTTDGAGIGDFTSNITELTRNTTYYVRAYASTNQSIAYGEEMSFNTPNVPIGAINGLFSVSDSLQVYFSQGNLQYIGNVSTPYWKFADNQWDYFDEYQQYNYNRSLFGWGTSGYNHGSVCYYPTGGSHNYEDFYAYGNWEYNLYDQTNQADWGYNAISNGGNQENYGWRTPTIEEWDYLFNYRNTMSGIRWTKGTVVGGHRGTILLPDDWDTSLYELNDPNGGNFTSNIFEYDDWINILEPNGAIFLPAAGEWSWSVTFDYYSGENWSILYRFFGTHGRYWSSSVSNMQGAYYISDGSIESGDRYNGHSVRLVKDYNP